MTQTTRRWAVIITGGLVMTAASVSLQAAGGVGQPARSSESSTSPRELLDRYCVVCHNQRLKTADLTLDTMDVGRVGANPEVWEKVVRKLRAGMMPPPGRRRPDRPTYDGLAAWAEGELDRAALAHPNPGRTEPYHRLNRVEYANAVRDILALDMDVSSLLPSDDASYGFDTIASVLTVSESVLEKYLSAARKISRAALGGAVDEATRTQYRISEDTRQYERVEDLPFGTRGGMLVTHHFPQDGEYVFTVEPYCLKSFAGCAGARSFPDDHVLELTLDGERVQLLTIEADFDPPRTNGSGDFVGTRRPNPKLEVRIPVTAGPREVGIAFFKLPSTEESTSPRRRSRGANIGAIYQPFIESLRITGPYDASGPGDTPSRRRLLVCRPANPSEEPACAQRIFSTLARRAYRRPVSEADLQPLLAFFEEGRQAGGFEKGVELALRRLLMSPEFLFRTEADPPGVPSGEPYRITDLELASRLSFFLWSSIPDDELMDVASRGQLRERAVLERQVRRMLADPRSVALTKNFASQWLQLRNLDLSTPDTTAYPDFSNSLRQSLRAETELFFESIVREDRSVVDLLTADYTFLNEQLARHYGIPHVVGSHFRRVTYSEDSPRRGLLGHGSILTITSHPLRTSPVLRGKWILETIVGMPPPAPPDNIPALPEGRGERARVDTLRERMAAHRANPVCASCHNTIDPPGFALENFDGVGRYRDWDDAFVPIDASGTLPDLTEFGGLAEFRQALSNEPERFVGTLTEKLLVYGLGRGLEYFDAPAVREIVRDAAASQYKLSALIVGIANSLPFQMRTTEPTAESPPVAGQ